MMQKFLAAAWLFACAASFAALLFHGLSTSSGGQIHLTGAGGFVAVWMILVAFGSSILAAIDTLGQP